jgi:hypothetical protein
MKLNGDVCGALVLLGIGLLLPIASTGAEPVARIPFNAARSRIMVPVTLNDSNGLSFMLDTGFSFTMVHPHLADALKLRRNGEITIEGIAGQEKAPTYEGATFRLGNATYEPRRVAALSSDSNGRRRRDGILGSGLFRQFVVEIDYARKQLALYSPTEFSYSGKGESLPLRFRRWGTTPIVDGSVAGTNGTPVRGEFEIDTGCDSGICLGHDFIQTHGLLNQGETREGSKFGVGGGASTRSGQVPQLQLGAVKIEKPETDFFLEGSPVDRGLAGHIGMGVLKNFKVTFDYSRRQMFLEATAQ